jgi:hypothetical protein
MVSIASGRVSAGRMVVSRRTCLGVPAPGWAKQQTRMDRTPAWACTGRLYPVGVADRPTELAASRDELSGERSEPHRLASFTHDISGEWPGGGMAPERSHRWDSCLVISNPSHSQDLPMAGMGPPYEPPDGHGELSTGSHP